jgi:hypothetical protein
MTTARRRPKDIKTYIPVELILPKPGEKYRLMFNETPNRSFPSIVEVDCEVINNFHAMFPTVRYEHKGATFREEVYYKRLIKIA